MKKIRHRGYIIKVEQNSYDGQWRTSVRRRWRLEAAWVRSETPQGAIDKARKVIDDLIEAS